MSKRENGGKGCPTLTFDRSASGAVIEAMGWKLTNFGYLWDGDAVMSITGQPVHIDEFAGVVEYKGQATPIRDDFNELLEYVKYHRETGDLSDTEHDHP